MSPENAEMAGEVNFRFTVSGLARDTFLVVNVSGEDALNGDYSFTMTLLSRTLSLNPKDLLEKEASFVIESRREGPVATMPYHGMIGEVEVCRQVFDRTEYKVTLVPRIARLALSEFSEVYTLEKDIPGLIEEVLKEAGFTSQDYQFKIVEGGRPRSFVCQYRETLRQFLHRWVEREGIVTYFDHSGEKERLLFYDQPHQKPSWTTSLVYRPPGDLDVGFSDDSLIEFSETIRPVTGKVVVQDFNYRKANLEIREEEVLDPRGKTLLEEYGENLRTNSEAKRQAKLLAEMVRCRERRFVGKSSAIDLRAGTTINVKSHFREELNGSFFIIRACFDGSLTESSRGPGSVAEQGRFTTSFEAILADVPFRPERKTPWPRISGVVQAIVEAEGSGKFAELNEYGEYKVRFPFALTKRKSQKGSGWVRLATPLAGAENGMHFPLRKETEVLVAFLGGDPDQPVILGALHNSEGRNLISNKNPEKNLIRSAGGHFLMLNDGNL